MKNVFQWISFGFVMFFAHGLITIPVVIVAGSMPFWIPSDFHVWVILGLAAALLLMPYVPGAAQGSSGMVYLVLPVLIPVFVLVPYGVGSLLKFTHLLDKLG